jgi:hypothetical protein
MRKVLILLPFEYILLKVHMHICNMVLHGCTEISRDLTPSVQRMSTYSDVAYFILTR